MRKLLLAFVVCCLLLRGPVDAAITGVSLYCADYCDGSIPAYQFPQFDPADPWSPYAMPTVVNMVVYVTTDESDDEFANFQEELSLSVSPTKGSFAWAQNSADAEGKTTLYATFTVDPDQLTNSLTVAVSWNEDPSNVRAEKALSFHYCSNSCNKNFLTITADTNAQTTCTVTGYPGSAFTDSVVEYFPPIDTLFSNKAGPTDNNGNKQWTYVMDIQTLTPADRLWVFSTSVLLSQSLNDEMMACEPATLFVAPDITKSTLECDDNGQLSAGQPVDCKIFLRKSDNTAFTPNPSPTIFRPIPSRGTASSVQLNIADPSNPHYTFTYTAPTDKSTEDSLSVQVSVVTGIDFEGNVVENTVPIGFPYYFSISVPAIVLTPPSKQVYYQGEMMPIRWTVIGDLQYACPSGVSVLLSYNLEEISRTTVVVNSSVSLTTHHFDWKVNVRGMTGQTSSFYALQISCGSGSDPIMSVDQFGMDSIGMTFQLLVGSVSIARPTGSDTWLKNSTVSIIWTFNGEVGPVDLYLLRLSTNDITKIPYNQFPKLNTSYSVPVSLASGTNDYSILIKPRDDVIPYATSDAFSIAKSNELLIAATFPPASGFSAWVYSDPQNITFTVIATGNSKPSAMSWADIYIQQISTGIDNKIGSKRGLSVGKNTFFWTLKPSDIVGGVTGNLDFRIHIESSLGTTYGKPFTIFGSNGGLILSYASLTNVFQPNALINLTITTVTPRNSNSNNNAKLDQIYVVSLVRESTGERTVLSYHNFEPWTDEAAIPNSFTKAVRLPSAIALAVKDYYIIAEGPTSTVRTGSFSILKRTSLYCPNGLTADLSTTSSGEIADHYSPNPNSRDPGPYRSSWMCEWSLPEPDPGNYLVVDLQYDIEQGYDYLLFTRGMEEKPYLELTGRSARRISTNQSLTVSFNSDASVQRTGFKASYYSSRCPNACSGHGTCQPYTSDAGASAFKCTCSAGFTGNACEIATDCSTLTTCSDCSTAVNCGFCSFTGKCMAGKASGPTGVNATCPADNWSFESCNDCTQSTDCYSCGLAGNCGWCNSTNSCMEGTSAGPTLSTCPAPSWQFSMDKCTSPDPCMSKTSCGSCTASKPACVWCKRDNKCYLPQSYKTADPLTSCAREAVSLANSTSDCPCSQNTCSTCTNNPSCVWCQYWNQCHDADYQIGNCSVARIGDPARCYDCGAFRDCGSCIDHNCNWCASDSKCSSGYMSYGTQAKCSSWSLTRRQCPVLNSAQRNGLSPIGLLVLLMCSLLGLFFL